MRFLLSSVCLLRVFVFLMFPGLIALLLILLAFSVCSFSICPSFLSFPFCCLLFFSFLYSFHSSFLFGLKSFRLSLFRLFPTFYCFRRSLFHALKILEVYIPSKKYLSASIGLLSSARASLIVLLAKRSLGRLCVDHGERPQAERSC